MEGSGLQQYKVVVVTVDDLVFNLNQIRYDFLKILYKEFDDLTYYDYSKCFGTSRSIYSFMHDQDKQQKVNDKIENFLYSEKNYKNIIADENMDEVLKLLQKQNKTVLAVTSHSSQLAKILLKKKNLHQYISQVLGISDFSELYPNLKVFNALLKYYEIEPEEMLVITSFNSILECLDPTSIHTMFVGNPKMTYIDSSLRPTYTLGSAFDLIQFAVYGKYNSNDLFSTVLGFDESMKDEEKANRYEFLKEKYKDTPELLSVVEGTYYGNDMAHTTSFDTKEFKMAYELLELSRKEEIKKQQEQEVVSKPPKKKKKNIFTKIIADLLIALAFSFVFILLHLAIYPQLSEKIKVVYDNSILAYPTIANYLFTHLTDLIGLTGRMAAIFRTCLLTIILYIIIDYIFSYFKK